MLEKKKILVISFYYPPSAQVGGKRFAFLSYILQRSYPVLHVLTVKKKFISLQDTSLPAVGTVHRCGIFPALFNDSNKNNIVRRAWNSIWAKYLCLVDPFAGWILPALVTGLNIIRKNKINVIIATGPPFSPMVLAFLLSKITGTKLILDYRDPWTNHQRPYGSSFNKHINLLLEKLVISQAAGLVFSSRHMKDSFVYALGRYTKAACHVIHNGYHSNDGIQHSPLGNATKNMIYAGAFYGERRLTLLAKPLSRLLKEGTISKETFCFHIFGNINNEDKIMIKNYGIDDIIREHSPVSYRKLLGYLKSADILVLISGTDVNYAIPYKFYDYLSVEIPLLAIAPENSAVAELMNEIDCGKLASIDNKDSISENLRSMILENKKYTFSGAQKYTWEMIASQYINIINSL